MKLKTLDKLLDATEPARHRSKEHNTIHLLDYHRLARDRFWGFPYSDQNYRITLSVGQELPGGYKWEMPIATYKKIPLTNEFSRSEKVREFLADHETALKHIKQRGFFVKTGHYKSNWNPGCAPEAFYEAHNQFMEIIMIRDPRQVVLPINA